MRGAGGPLLCIVDLLSNVGEAESSNPTSPSPSPSPLSCSPAASGSAIVHSSSDLPKLYQEDYNKLAEALAKGDNSWTALTLKLFGGGQQPGVIDKHKFKVAVGEDWRA